MLFEKIQHIAIGNKFYGVEVYIEGEQITYFVVFVTKEKHTLSIKDTFFTNDFENLKEKIDSGFPLLMTFNGTNIISKQQEFEPNYRSKILFNSNPKDFYWFEYQKKDTVFVSVARKETIDFYLKKFEEAGFYVIQANVGPFVSVTTYPLLNQYTITTLNHQLNFIEDELESFSLTQDKSDVKYHLGDQEILNKYLIPFASILNYLLPAELISNSLDEISDNKSELAFKKLLSKVGFASIIVLFITLLINFFLLENYQNKINEATSELALKQSAYDKVLKLKKDKKNKEAILKKSGIHNSHFLSFYTWQLAEAIPNEVQLSKLDIFPIIGKIKKEAPVNFSADKISVEGFVVNNKSLSEWIKKIKKFKWVKSVEILDFKNQNRTNKFILKIFVKSNV